MLQYTGMTIMKDTSHGDKIVVEWDSTTLTFYDCSMKEIAEFIAAISQAEGIG